MAQFFTQLRIPALASLFLLLPFVMLELVNRRPYQESFPFPLFGFLWLLQVAFMLGLKPVMQCAQAGRVRQNWRALLLAAGCLVLIAGLWLSILLDQVPCFLGGGNCD